MRRKISGRRAEVSPVAILFALLLIVVFVSATYGMWANIGQQMPTWGFTLIVALLGIGLLFAFKRGT